MTSKPQEYDLARIRELLQNAFTPQELRRFCQDRKILEPAVREFGPYQSGAEWVDALIDYCQTNMLFPELLAHVKGAKPRRFAKHKPYIHKEIPIRPAPNKQSRATAAVGLLAVLLSVAIALLIYFAATGTIGGATQAPEPTALIPVEEAGPSGLDSNTLLFFLVVVALFVGFATVEWLRRSKRKRR